MILDTLPGYNLKREIDINCTAVSRAKIKVEFRGQGAYTDGVGLIKLPAIDDASPYKIRDARILRGYADHESAHILYTPTRKRQQMLADKTGIPVDQIRSGDFNPKPDRRTLIRVKSIHDFWNCAEDWRIEHHLMRDWRGTRDNLNALREHVVSKDLVGIRKNPKSLENPFRAAGAMITWHNAIANGYTCANMARTCLEIARKVNPEVAAMIDEMWARILATVADDDVTANQKIMDEAELLADTILIRFYDPKPNPQQHHPQDEAQDLDPDQDPNAGQDNDGSENSKDADPNPSADDEQDTHDDTSQGPSDKTQDTDEQSNDEAESATDQTDNVNNRADGAESTADDADDQGGSDCQDEQDEANSDLTDDETSSNTDADTGAENRGSDDDTSRSDGSDTSEDQDQINDTLNPADHHQDDTQSGTDLEPNTNTSNPDTDAQPKSDDVQSNETDPSDPAPSSESSNQSDHDVNDTPAADAEGYQDAQDPSNNRTDDDDADAREERIRKAAQAHEPEDQDRLDIGEILAQIGEIAEKLAKEGCIPSPTPIGATVRIDRSLQGPSDLAHYNSARERLAGVTSALAGSLRSLVIARDVRRRSPNREDGQLDMRNITAIATMSPDIYVRTTVTRSNNTAITFLGDVSISMTEPADEDADIDDEEDYRRRIDLYFDAKIAITEALGPARRVVTRYLAYTNHGNSIPLFLIKDFTDNILTARAGIDRLMSQIANAQFQMGATPTGEAMLEAWAGMRERREDKKILIVITDGEPNDGGLAERAASMIRQEGGYVIGVSVGSQEPLFRMPFWIMVPAIQELPTKLLTALRPIL